MDRMGSTASIEMVWPGVMLKKPHQFNHEKMIEHVDHCFSVEPRILEELGEHPRIVRYLGKRDRSLLLGQASHGNLQDYLDSNPSTSVRQRVIWCHQLTEAMMHIHHHDVLHSDLRPENILVHENTPGSRDLLLCDFGGSTCKKLGLEGSSVPDGPFYHPMFEWKPSQALDIFGLGSLFYTIFIGCWPYRTTPGRLTSFDEQRAYEDAVNKAFNAHCYPDVTSIPGGSVILACWRKQYETAEELLRALQREMPIPEAEEDPSEARHSSLPLVTAIAVATLAALTHILFRQQKR